MKALLASLPLLVPIGTAWVEKQEAYLLRKGDPLTESQIADARLAGVSQPEKIRFLRVEELPEIDHSDLLFFAKQVGLFSGKSPGLALGHGICVRSGPWDDRYAFVHQCVHIAQLERLGGIRAFLHDYIRECIEPGYPFGPMEQQAILVAKDICKPSPSSPASK